MSIMRNALVAWYKPPDKSVLHQTPSPPYYVVEPEPPEPPELPPGYKPGYTPDMSPICTELPKTTIGAMENLTEHAYAHPIYKQNTLDGTEELVGIQQVEAGAPIHKDGTIGQPTYGDKRHVTVLRDDDTVGVFHTHAAGGSVNPSAPGIEAREPGKGAEPGFSDILDMVQHNDTVTCIGEYNPLTGPRIKCFTPHEPGWTEFRNRLIKWQDDLDQFNRRMVRSAPPGYYGTKFTTHTGRPKRITLRNILNHIAQIRDTSRPPLPPGKTINQLIDELARQSDIVDREKGNLTDLEFERIKAKGELDDALHVYQASIQTIGSSEATEDPVVAIENADKRLNLAQKDYQEALHDFDPYYNIRPADIPYYTTEAGQYVGKQPGPSVLAKMQKHLDNAGVELVLANRNLNKVWGSYVGNSKPDAEAVLAAEHELNEARLRLNGATGAFNIAVGSNNVKRIADAFLNIGPAQEAYNDAEQKYQRLIEPKFIDEVRTAKIKLEETQSNYNRLDEAVPVQEKIISGAENQQLRLLEEIKFAQSNTTERQEQERRIQSLYSELESLEFRRRDLLSELRLQSQQLARPLSERVGKAILDDCYAIKGGLFSEEYYAVQNILEEEL